MFAPVLACPAVVRSVAVTGGGRYDAALKVQICDCVCKFVVFLEGHNKFCVVCSNFGGEGDVCCSEGSDRSAITSRSGGKFGDGVHRFLLVNEIRRLIFVLVEVISRLEPGAGRSDLQFGPFLVSGRKGGFKGCPCFASGWQALTGFAFVEEEASLKD